MGIFDWKLERIHSVCLCVCGDVMECECMFFMVLTVDIMEREGKEYDIRAAAISTYGCSWQSSLCFVVCVVVVLWSVNVYLLEGVCACCCLSWRTESLLYVIIIMLYRSS